MLSRRSIGADGFSPVYVKFRPPKLKMLRQIKGKSLDELEEIIVGFS